MNLVVLKGNIGAPPELKFTEGGSAMMKFPLATTERWKRSGDSEIQEKTTWHKCVVWGKRAEALNKILDKGKEVLIEGRIDYFGYQTDDGKNHKSASVNVSKLEFCGRKGDGAPRQDYSTPGYGDYSPPPQESVAPQVDQGQFEDDDIPF